MQKLPALLLILTLALPASAERFVVLFRKGAAWNEAKAPNEQMHFSAHSANLAALRKSQQLILGTRYSDVGMIVVEAPTEADARALIDRDPTIAAKVFAYELHPARFFYDPLPAPPTRTFDVTADVSHLTDAQRQWLTAFERDAAAPDLAAHASAAKAAGLVKIGEYLDTGARVLRGEATVEELEKAFRRTLDEPLHVMLRVLDGKIADVVVAVPNRELSRQVSRESVHAFERTLPGFAEEWLAPIEPEEIGRVATLRFRAGRGFASASPGSYLPFDRTLNASVGRTWIVYDNLLPAGWFATKVKPAADAVLPSIASSVTGKALLHWYALRTAIYDAGPNLTQAQLTKFSTDKDPLRILKGDVLSTLAAGATDEQLATLLAVTFHTLYETYAGIAPPAHRPASNALVNWLVSRKAIRFENGTWTADFAVMRTALNELAREILEIESALNAPRARTFLAQYGRATPEIDRTSVTIAALPKVTLVPRYR
ncbi:MAG TPA: hypothetical protein VFV49_13595 [Thermoanaerobaculia bacterium]|nr:hypothetical protein [Thermoanaerobaculia bacterium]